MAPFDAARCAGAAADDLDSEKMARFIRTARHARQFPLPEGTPPLQLLEHLNLLNDGRLTKAAVLLFGRTPRRFLISSEVRCGTSRSCSSPTGSRSATPGGCDLR